MKKVIAVVAAALILIASCKPHLSHRERINLDSTGERRSKKIPLITHDSTFSYRIDTGEYRAPMLFFKVGDPDYPVWLVEISLQTDSFKTYRQNGKWHIENPAASLEMLYQYTERQDSLHKRPFVIITPTDTFNFYHGDTIHVGPDKNLQQIIYKP